MLLLGVANFGVVLSNTINPSGTENNITEEPITTPDPLCDIPTFDCYKNDNGMCRRFGTPCDAKNVKNKFGQVISKYES